MPKNLLYEHNFLLTLIDLILSTLEMVLILLVWSTLLTLSVLRNFLLTLLDLILSILKILSISLNSLTLPNFTDFLCLSENKPNY